MHDALRFAKNKRAALLSEDSGSYSALYIIERYLRSARDAVFHLDRWMERRCCWRWGR
jgi:hypothetical protein